MTCEAISSLFKASYSRLKRLHQEQPESLGLIWLLLSAWLLSTMGVFLQKAASFNIPSTELVFFRALFQGSFVLLGMLTFHEESKGEGNIPAERLIFHPFGRTQQEIQLVLIRGMVGACSFICVFYSIKSLPLGDALTIISMYPIYTIFMAKIFLKEQIRWIHISASLCSIMGAMFITGPSFLPTFHSEEASTNMTDSTTVITTNRTDSNDPKDEDTDLTIGYMVAFLGGIFAAAVLIFIRKAGKLGLHTLQLLSSWCIFGATFSFICGMTLFQSLEGPWIVPPSKEAYGYILAYCSIGSVAHFLLNYAARFCRAGVASIVRSSDILWAYLYQVVVFQEQPMKSTMFGVLLIILALSMIAIDNIWNEQDNASSTERVGSSRDKIFYSVLEAQKSFENDIEVASSNSLTDVTILFEDENDTL